jgi:hypothetical protein
MFMQNEMNDKRLREKLGSYHAPFDANAWTQMNTMLDNRKKRRGFFWLWFSGTSVAAVMAAMSLTLLSPQQNAIESAELTSAVVAESVSSETTQFKSNELMEHSSAAQTGNAKNIHNAKVASHLLATNESNATLLLSENRSISKSDENTSSSKSLRKAAKRKYKALITHNHQSTQSSVKASITEEKSSEPIGAESKSVLLASINPLPVVLLSTSNSENEISKKTDAEEGVVKLPIKRKLFHYELGIVAGASASFTQGIFYNNPNWFAGVQQAFRFGKYVAVTNAIQYSKTAFSLHHVANTDSAFSPSYYSSTIHSVAIPIGLNVYPVSSKKVNWYLGVGIVNHIKVKENLNFEVPDEVAKQMDNLANNVPTTSGNIVEQFWNEKSKSAASNNQYRLGSKHYFANFYATTGVEVKILPMLLMNVGATYQLNITGTGKQNARPMYFGGEAGLRYRF